MKYAWIIDEDKLFDPQFDVKSRVGTIGPRNAPEHLLKRHDRGEGDQFRMLCDGEKNYTYAGRIIYDDPDDVTLFEPIDDFGGPDAGCTIIQYRQPEGWEALDWDDWEEL